MATPTKAKQIGNKEYIKLIKKNQFAKVLQRNDSSISVYDENKLKDELARMVREEQ